MIRHLGTLFIASLLVCAAACSARGSKDADGAGLTALFSDTGADDFSGATGGALQAGSTALGGNIATGGGGVDLGAGGSIAMDAKLSTAIDLSIWSLQLPIGTGTSPTTISPQQLLAGFSNDYFYQEPTRRLKLASDLGTPKSLPTAGVRDASRAPPGACLPCGRR
jgi:hypothetical protein